MMMNSLYQISCAGTKKTCEEKIGAGKSLGGARIVGAELRSWDDGA